MIGVVTDPPTEGIPTPAELWKAGALECPGCGSIIFVKMAEKPALERGDPEFALELSDWIDSDWFLLEFPSWTEGLRKMWVGFALLLNGWVSNTVVKTLKVNLTKQQQNRMTLMLSRQVRGLLAKVRKERPEINKLLKKMEGDL